MRRFSRTAVVFVTLSGVACAVDRSGGGEAMSGSTAGSSPVSSVESGGSAGAAGDGSVVGTAGVFGVATGNAGGGSGASNQDDEGGASVVDSGSVEPDHTGTVVPVDATIAVEASTPKDASSISSCAVHPSGQTFTPNGSASGHCYWAHSAKSAWQDAADACTTEGGHLATVRSAAENTFVIKLIDNLADSDRIWLGGTDNKTDTDRSGGGPYVWITGESFSYAPWAGMNPDGNCTGTCGGRECECQHRVCVGPDGAFWDRWEADQNYSVCESEP